MNNKSISFSPLIIGTMRLGQWGAKFKQDQMEQFIDECLEIELMDFDLADIYGDYTTEEEFGEVLRQKPHLRSKMRLTTKCGIRLVASNRPENTIKSYDLSASHIRKSVEKSLVNLHTDYLDLLLLHRPDYLMHPAEVAEIFSQLKKEGKVRNFGVSNFSASQFDLLNSYFPLRTNQLEISLQHRDAFDNGTLDQCIKHQIVPTAWSPLGGGAIFSSSSTTDSQSIKVTAQAIAMKYDIGIYEVLLAWLKKHPSGIVPLLGTSRIDRVKAAKKALDVTMTSEEWYALWQAAAGGEIA